MKFVLSANQRKDLRGYDSLAKEYRWSGGTTMDVLATWGEDRTTTVPDPGAVVERSILLYQKAGRHSRDKAVTHLLARSADGQRLMVIVGQTSSQERDEAREWAGQRPLIVSRHGGTVEWLHRRGVDGEVVAHVDDIKIVHHRVVYGALPYHLAVAAEEIRAVEMPHLKVGDRGRDLTPEEMDAAGARVTSYRVTKV
jgi:putative CRISPR-associated protein (TIGR02620 family)